MCEGTAEAVGSYVSRLNLREHLPHESLQALPQSASLSEAVGFNSAIITAYDAAGFQFRAMKESYDQNGTAYAAVLAYIDLPDSANRDVRQYHLLTVDLRTQ